ncbi:MAG TPA: ATP-binding cassette domain-containing protein [Candidatus Kapabacteria bacterium]|nr:ATP-binding cassette domain-containing protein [Candidatus Kapabacteria bacterium]
MEYDTVQSPIAVSVKNLSLTYPARRKTAARQALKGVSFSVEPGTIFGLLGQNGSGKSTLFKILSTFLPPTSGSAELFGFDVMKAEAAVRKKTGVLFQSPSLDKKLTVGENLMHQGHLYGLKGSLLHERIKMTLERLGLYDRRNDLAESLSGGQQRRVEIAKGLLHLPAILLLDEPSTGLDPAARRDLWSYLVTLRDTFTMTILFTTHIMEEAEVCDRLVIMDQGNIVASGSPAELKERIGGDVITIMAKAPDELSVTIAERFHIQPSVVDGCIRIELHNGHEFIPRLVEAFSGAINSINLSKPTLEDVFIHLTGRRFEEETNGKDKV